MRKAFRCTVFHFLLSDRNYSADHNLGINSTLATVILLMN